MTTISYCREQKRQHLAHLISRQNVVACGVGFKQTREGLTDEPCVVVSVTKKVPQMHLAASDLVPQKLGDAKTDVVETGVIRALRSMGGHWRPVSLKRSHTDHWRPAPGGVSIGHVNVSAGTLGCLIVRDGELFILSNNHVLADTNAGQPGDAILQPGGHDGGTEQIATLEDFIPINFGDAAPTCRMATAAERIFNWVAELLGSRHRAVVFQEAPAKNLVDAAIALPISDNLVDRRILGIGVPKGSRQAELGAHVKKSGRTTGLTTGRITQIDVTTQVGYGGGLTAVFDQQLMAGPMSAGGDSGSVVLDEGGFVVGLLFAGSDAVTIINPIEFVLEALRVEIAT